VQRSPYIQYPSRSSPALDFLTMEFMSNISGIDEAKPSLFELLSETQLRELLEPSLRYLLAVATHRHPRYLIRILNRYNEVYALLMLLVERHYLSRWGGSFTENFYGLKRERVIAAQVPRAQRVVPGLVAESTKLRRADVWKSLFVIVGALYLYDMRDCGLTWRI
jgi:peroxin-12